MPATLGAGLRILGRLLGALAGLITLAGLLGGVPWLLVVFIGSPLPDLLTAWNRPLDDATILNLLAVFAWALWAIFARDVAAEVFLTVAEAAGARHGRPPPPRPPPGGPVRLLAAVLVGAIAAAVLFDLAGGALTHSPAGRGDAAFAAAHTPAVAVAPANPTTGPAAHGGPRPALSTPVPTLGLHAAGHDWHQPPVWARDAPGGVHHVVKGDNLWDIAEANLADPYRWRDIYVLNRDKPQANGYALTDPDLIHIGWWLALPTRSNATLPVTTEPPVTTPPATGHNANDADPSPPTQRPTTACAATPTPTPPSATTRPTPAGSAAAPGTAGTSPTVQASGQGGDEVADQASGVRLASQAWVSVGLAALIAAVASLLRLQRRRHARLTFPIPLRTGPTASPVPASLRAVDTAGSRVLELDSGESSLAATVAAPPPVPASVGLDHLGRDISLFDLPAGIALHGDGAIPAARAILASALSTGVLESLFARPIVVTSTDTLTRLLPPDTAPIGLHHHNATFDPERLVVVDETAAAIAHLEEEMIHRWRTLDSLDVDTVTALNSLDGHAESLSAWVLLIHASPRHAARMQAVATHAAALHLHLVILGDTGCVPNVVVGADGTVVALADHPGQAEPVAVGGLTRLSTLAASDLVDVLALVRAAAPRPEVGVDVEDTNAVEAGDGPGTLDLTDIPTLATGAVAQVRLTVLGPVPLATDTEAIRSGVRSGSLAVLALLAAHPQGRTLDEIVDDLHRDVDPAAAAKRVRTDINSIRTVLRQATGIDGKGSFVTYDGDTGRYRLDPDLIDVDLWRMLTAIGRANRCGDDEDACLAALREAVACYGGEFAADQDRAWIIDYATTYRHQYLSALSRIAEILEPDHGDQAVAALEQALAHDPINEEIYQRIMRIHGRANRPDQVRRVMRLLETRLADLGEAEPSDATRRVAARQVDRATSPR